MILFEKAYNIVMNSARSIDKERVAINDSLHRILSEDIFSDIEMPPFNKSAMDGYACRKEDFKNELKVIEIIPAGKIPQKVIHKNQCSKVMTGAIIPQGADCVLIVEHTEKIGSNKIRFIKNNTNSNICYKAEDIKQGQCVLKKGTKIEPQHIAILSSVGCVNPLVSRKVQVGIITTGNELVEPDKKPGFSQIRNSNAYQLIAQLKRIGAVPNYFGIVEDSEEATYNVIVKALSTNDVIIITGGVSMGDFDYVPKMLEKAGIKILFDKVAVQPGKPTTFGISNDKYCFGLPGNPVSSFVQFELLVKPFIYKMMGMDYEPLTIKMPLAVDYTRKKAKRKSWIPVKITKQGFVKPLEYHGSAHIHSLVYADGIISIPIGETIIEKGKIIDVRQI